MMRSSELAPSAANLLDARARRQAEDFVGTTPSAPHLRLSLTMTTKCSLLPYDERMKNVAKAIEISRPLLWLNTSMPFLWGALATRGSLQPLDLVLFLFFLFPYNYFLHAPNDYFDYETDRRNPRKGGVEGALTPKELLAKHAAVSSLVLAPFALVTAAWFPPLTLASLGLLLLLSAAYNAPPTRLKGRPIADSLTNVLYAIPLQVGIHAAGGTEPLSPHVMIFAAWGIGAHALTTITDRDEDEAAGVRTIAVLLGRRATAAFAAAWFVLVGVGAATITGTPLAFAVALPYLSLSVIGRDATGEAGRRLYRLFLVTNVILGAGITIIVLLNAPIASAVAAAALAIFGTAIALGASVGRSALRARTRA